jgi:predicted nucleotidyltransferase
VPARAWEFESPLSHRGVSGGGRPLTDRNRTDVEGAFIPRLIDSCRADDRVVAAFLGGSRARGEADEFSDVDVSVIVADEAFAEVVSDKAAFVRTLGEPLFLEDFDNEQVAFAIFADGTELELHFLRRSKLADVRPGPFRTLLDEDEVLAVLSSEGAPVDGDAQVEHLRRILFWFWHDVGHLTSAIGRSQLWWAAGQLEQLRGSCANLVRIQQNVEVDENEPFWKLDEDIGTENLDELRSTFTPLERDAMLEAGRAMVDFFRRTAPAGARAHGLGYPAELDRLVGGHLERLGT